MINPIPIVPTEVIPTLVFELQEMLGPWWHVRRSRDAVGFVHPLMGTKWMDVPS